MSTEPAAIEPVPIDLVLAGRELTEPRLSPDGRTVAFVQRWGGRSAVTIVDVDGGPERMLTTSPDPRPGRGMDGGCFDWLADGSGVVYVAVDGELWLQPRAGRPRRLTTFERSCAAPAVASNGSFAVAVVDEAEVWLVPIDSDGAVTRRLDDGGEAFAFDPSIAPAGDEVCWQAWSPPDMPWDGALTCRLGIADGSTGQVQRWRPDGGAVQQPRYTPGGVRTCVHDGTGWLNVQVGDRAVRPEPVEQAGPTWGMGQRTYAVAPDDRAVAICRNELGFGRLTVVDLDRGVSTDVGRGTHGHVGWAGESIVALRSGARTPTQIVRYDARTFDRTVLAVGPAAGWDELALPEPDLVAIEHDGTTLHARRYARDRGRLLVWVHGGPTDQWQVDFRPRVAYWWSRGWDVLVVDPRGSTGHGRAYQRALNGAWGRLDVDDTAALVAAAHARGWADPATTVAIGASSGGLTVLGLLADHGAIVAGGVASSPVSDLLALTRVTHRFEAHYTDTLVGPLDRCADRYSELSPINRADRITKSLLVFHGTDDPVVPIDQSNELVERVRAAGGSVDYVVYEGEGHGFRNPVNQRDEYERTEHFLDALVPP